MRTFHRGWPRVNMQSRAQDAMSLNFNAGPPYGVQVDTAKPVVANDKVVFMALGTFFGLMFFLFGIQIYIRCVWRRIQTSVILEEDDSESEEEMTTRADIYIREIGRRRTWRRRLNHYFDERSDSSSRAEHIPVGLDKSVLELLPTFVFNVEAAFRDEMVCAVCLEEFVDGERGRLLPKCSHCFHVQCIDMWFLSHSSCPLCRCEVSLPSSMDKPDTSSDPLLQSSGTSPEFPVENSQQQQPQQEPWPGPYASIMTGLLRVSATREECPEVVYSPRSAAIASDASFSANVISESASITGAHDSNDALNLERGSSLPDTAAAIALEVSDGSTSATEENNQPSNSQRRPAEVELVVRRESSSDILSTGSVPHRRDSPGSVLCLEYQPDLRPSTSAAGATHLDEFNTAASFTSSSPRSPHHARKRSYLAVEIIGEYHQDASGAMSQVTYHQPTQFIPSRPEKEGCVHTSKK